MLSSYYRIAIFAALFVLLLGAGYYSGLFSPEAASRRVQADAPADDEEVAPDQEVTLRTAYLDPPVGKAHRIFVKWQPDGSGELWLDETKCRVNRLGDELPAQPATQASAVRFDAAGKGASGLFDIRGIAETHYRIVKPRPTYPSYRILVLDQEERVSRVVTLERWRLASSARHGTSVRAE